MSDIESPLWSEIDASNISPAPDGYPANSSPLIVYSNGRAEMAALKRWWNRVNPTVTSGGSANAQTLAYSVAPTEGYKTGQTFTFIAGFSNSGPCTLNVNGLGAKAIQLNGAALAAGAIIAGSITQCMYDGTQFQLTLAGSGAYLPLTGGTLTGPLVTSTAGNNSITINSTTSGDATLLMSAPNIHTRHIIGANVSSATSLWELVLGNPVSQSGSNAGANFDINRFTDAGTYIDTPLSISRASGLISVADAISLDNTVAANQRNIWGKTSGSNRWLVNLGDNIAEGGSNAGSNFQIVRYTDAGAAIDVPLTINRASGVATFSAAPTSPSMTIAGPAATNRLINFTTTTGGATPGARFQMYTSSIAESGSNAGSNFGLDAYTDAGSAANVFTVARSTRVVNFAVAIVNGPSDRSLKENIAPLEDSLDKVLALEGVSFDFIGKEGRQIGFIAQDVAPIVPEVIQDYQSQDGDGQPTAGLLALDYPKLTALLVEAIKELNAKIVSLEARAGLA